MTYAIPCGETFSRMAECACCGAQFERDPVFPEVVSCDMCNAEPSGVECDHVNTTCAICERN